MRKIMRCRDVGMECDFVARGKTDEEVVRQAERHAKEVHGLTAVTPDLAARVRAAIKEQRLP